MNDESDQMLPSRPISEYLATLQVLFQSVLSFWSETT